MNSTAPQVERVSVAIATARPVRGGAVDRLLAADELVRAGSYRLPDERARFVTGRAVLRMLIAEWAGCLVEEVRLDARCAECGQPHGRPRPTEPAAARVVRTSVSHAGDYVVVVASHAEVGVDVEAVAAVGFTTFDEVGLSPAERRQLAALPAAARGPARARLWAEKEAVLKLHGVGLAVSPASLDLGVAEHSRVVEDPVRPGGRIALAHLGVGPDYRACLAVDSPRLPVVHRVNADRMLAAAAGRVSSATR